MKTGEAYTHFFSATVSVLLMAEASALQVSGYIGNGAVKECGLVVCAGLRELVLHGFEREHGKLVEVAPGQHAVEAVVAAGG